MCYAQGELARARIQLNAGLAAASGAGEMDVVAFAENLLGHVEHAAGNEDAARAWFASAVLGFRRLATPWGLGNALTGMRGDCLSEGARIVAGGRAIFHGATFSAVPPGDAFWYVNSNGLVEIAVNGGRADRVLGLGIGSAVSPLP